MIKRANELTALLGPDIDTTTPVWHLGEDATVYAVKPDLGDDIQVAKSAMLLDSMGVSIPTPDLPVSNGTTEPGNRFYV